MSHICKKPYFHSTGLSFDCGSCRSCRLKRRSEWSQRMIDHSSTVEHKTLFITLTYSQAHLPKDYSLSKKDCQKFFKRLRKRLPKGTKISYYLCGEYGPKTRRPHYHLILFGLDYSYSQMIFEAWGLCDPSGFKCIYTIDSEAFKYVTGYTCKKIGTNYNKKFITEYGIQPEFQLQSHGIGKQFALKSLSISNPVLYRNGLEVVPPRYYRKVLGLSADIYKDKIEDYQNELNEKIASLKQYYPGKSFTELSNMIRIENDLTLRQREQDWRSKL